MKDYFFSREKMMTDFNNCQFGVMAMQVFTIFKFSRVFAKFLHKGRTQESPSGRIWGRPKADPILAEGSEL